MSWSEVDLVLCEPQSFCPSESWSEWREFFLEEIGGGAVDGSWSCNRDIVDLQADDQVCSVPLFDGAECVLLEVVCRAVVCQVCGSFEHRPHLQVQFDVVPEPDCSRDIDARWYDDGSASARCQVVNRLLDDFGVERLAVWDCVIGENVDHVFCLLGIFCGSLSLDLKRKT